jgi:putative DNA primase/helicase
MTAVSSVTASILNRLHKIQKSGTGWKVLCPAHNDHHQSLSITEKDGKVLLNCFTGCTPEAIVEALGLEMSGNLRLWVLRPSNQQG